MFAENSIAATASTTAVVASTSIACHEDEPKTMPQPPTVAENTAVHHKEDQEVQVNEKEQRLKKRKQYLESGVGGGKKKQRIVTSFYDTLWPILEEAGWKLVRTAEVASVGSMLPAALHLFVPVLFASFLCYVYCRYIYITCTWDSP